MLKNAQQGNFKYDEANFLTLSRIMSEQYNNNIVPFQKFLNAKAINEATVALTGDKTGHALLGWLSEMTNQHRELIKLANKIGTFR
jgi:cell division inhibitor SulA